MSRIRLSVGLLVIAISTAPAVAAPTCRIQELPTADVAWLLFGSFRGGDFSSSIHAIRPDGSGECRISRHASGRPGALDPTVSPDGSRLAFTRGGGGSHQVSLWSDDGAQEILLLTDVMVRFRNGRTWPSFSPDGERILFVTDAGGERVIQILENSERTSLGQGEFPAWSPDGEWIAFNGTALGVSQVFIMRADGSERRALTAGPSSGFPTWSPDGSRIAFCRSVGEQNDLYTMYADGSDPAAITSTPDRSERHPAWSPDGTHIAFTARPPDSPDGWQRSVYVMPAGGGIADQVTNSRYHDTRPSWIPAPKPPHATLPPATLQR